MSHNLREYVVDEESGGRLDQLLGKKLQRDMMAEAPSRSQIKKSIERGEVKVNDGVVTKAGVLLRRGDRITVDLGGLSTAPSFEPADIPLDVIFEDQDLIVINKQAGLTMHPGAGQRGGTLVHALIHHYGQAATEGFSGSPRPGIVHRLDKDTTGIVVIAKSVRSLDALAQQFSTRSVERRYVALVQTVGKRAQAQFREEAGVIDRAIGRHPVQRTKMSVVAAGGRRAVTNWRVRERFANAALLELRLETGRTHQIRVHLSSIGVPIVGDSRYGSSAALPNRLRLAAERFGRQALHAEQLGFTHPRTAQFLRFERPPPAEMLELISLFRALE